MNNSLNNKTILVTGASSGIGQTTAITLSKLGVNVIITARNAENLNQTLSLMNKGTHQVISADLTKDDEILLLGKTVSAIDGWVHCAGKVLPVPVKFIKNKHIEDVFAVNFNSAVKLSAALINEKKLNSNSSVVFISSVSTLHSYFGGSLYIASKAALEGFAKTLALELLSKKIRVNTLQPALVRTPIYTSTIEAAVDDAEMKKHEARYPLGIGEPEDIANTIAFFLSDNSKWITGTCLKMDGGLTLGF